MKFIFLHCAVAISFVIIAGCSRNTASLEEVSSPRVRTRDTRASAPTAEPDAPALPGVSASRSGLNLSLRAKPVDSDPVVQGAFSAGPTIRMAEEPMPGLLQQLSAENHRGLGEATAFRRKSLVGGTVPGITSRPVGR